jgi:glucose-6-phosphate isomerase
VVVQRSYENKALGIVLDAQRMNIPEFSIEDWGSVHQAMIELEEGMIANPDEDRQVGHYWLRSPSLAANLIQQEVENSWEKLDVLQKKVMLCDAQHLLMIGIGGSALGPQLLVNALPSNGLSVHFLDNTDPEGMDRVLSGLDLSKTLVAVLSKSGGTKETRNAMLEARRAFEDAKIDFTKRAIAVTVTDSKLYQLAKEEEWMVCLPLWDWVGGRTSVTGMVGLLPLALSGRDWRAFLGGAATMDQWTRNLTDDNPALQIAHAWYCIGEGTGSKDMVVLPYKDSLLLFSRYLQQLIMESIGKDKDLSGNSVEQGLTVYGNKGSTDQHAFVQQLRDGPNNFFVTFVGVLESRKGKSIEVEPGVTAGDYLMGFLLGTRNALTEAGKSSMTIVLETVDEKSLGALIALYERAVGYYASKININAYHQPGVEAGKRAAADIIALQKKLIKGDSLEENDDTWLLQRYLSFNGRIS